MSAPAEPGWSAGGRRRGRRIIGEGGAGAGGRGEGRRIQMEITNAVLAVDTGDAGRSIHGRGSFWDFSRVECGTSYWDVPRFCCSALP